MLRLGRSLGPTAFTVARHGRCQPQRRFTTNLEREITRTIMATGPISFAKYMEMCLQHPTEGYYARATSESEIVGAKGDFVTSPEISQHFGEIIAIWLISVWNQIGPDVPHIRLVELGPGKGTLIGDVMQTVKALCRTPRSLTSVDLVESSAMLEQHQRDALSRRFHGTVANPDSSVPVNWHKSFDGIQPKGKEFTAVIAHELFDALPVHIIEKTANGWQEVLVDTVPAADSAVAGTPSLGAGSRMDSSAHALLPRAFRFVLSGPSLLANKIASASPRFSKLDLPTGTRIEVCPLGYDLARKVGRFISHGGGHGAALLVDYGDERFFGESARAFYKHRLVDIFHRPGETDLTANVDFAFLKEAAAAGTGVRSHGPLSQAEFLKRMGLDALLARSLSRTTDTDVQSRLMKAAGRLVDIGLTGMGRQYQFLGLTTASADSEVYPFVKM